MKYNYRCQACCKLLKSEIKERQFCFRCLPEGQTDTSNLTLTVAEGMELICQNCKQTYKHKKDYTTRKFCGKCRSNVRNWKMKERATNYLGNKCSVCGYDKCLAALQFHHKDPTTKAFTIGKNLSLSWEKVKQELDKCVLLCSNCHAEHHYSLWCNR